ncbi:MAG TPA: hypothetical protein VFE98_08670 [Candidatus Bathyarchaeia archaeon]|nr:hypothetical protein [Candidatus Bathyarchaeia archaeon]
MGLRVPYWRKIDDPALALLDRFSWRLRKQDLEVFQDMMRQCELYSFSASEMGSTVKEIPLLMAIIFGQHKMILELQRKCESLIGTTVNSSLNTHSF